MTDTHAADVVQVISTLRTYVLWLKLVLLYLQVVGVAKFPQYPPCGFMSSSLDEELVEEEETLGNKGGGKSKRKRRNMREEGR